MPVVITCANCGNTKSITPSHKHNKTGLHFCGQDCWIEYRTLHTNTGTKCPNNLCPNLIKYHEPMKRFLQNQPGFVRSRDIAPPFSAAYPNFCPNMSDHAKTQQVGKILMAVCEPYSGNVKAGHVVLYKNPYAVKNAIKGVVEV